VGRIADLAAIGSGMESRWHRSPLMENVIGMCTYLSRI